MNLAVLMADGDGLDFLQYWNRPGSAVAELALVFGIVVFVVLVIFSWATFWRKPRRHRRHSYQHTGASAGTPAVGLPRRRRRRPLLLRVLRRHHRRRRHRRRHRQVNPTLADVGGLPPARHHPPSVP